jgi:hypothetical protein
LIEFLGFSGLLMPKMVVNDLGITRTDIGCLGYGIYFSDSVSTSLKYTTPSRTRPGRRLLCISQVALGDSAKCYSYSPDLTKPPDNFHSTHGVKKNNENNSKFVVRKYLIYQMFVLFRLFRMMNLQFTISINSDYFILLKFHGCHLMLLINQLNYYLLFEIN